MEDKKERGTWKSADTMTEEEAALTIQSLYRTRKVTCSLFPRAVPLIISFSDPEDASDNAAQCV
jgi:hypothetical protein